MTHISNINIRSLLRLLQHVIPDLRESAVLRLQINNIQYFLRNHVSHGVSLDIIIQLSWSASLKLHQATFPSIERGAQSTTHQQITTYRKKTTNTHYDNLLSTTPRPHRKQDEQPVTAEITRPSHTPVTSLHPASSCELQQVLLDPFPFLDVLSLACCASLVSDPAPFPGASPLLSKRHTCRRGVLTPWSLTLDSKLVLSFLILGGSLPWTLSHDPYGLVTGPFQILPFGNLPRSFRLLVVAMSLSQDGASFFFQQVLLPVIRQISPHLVVQIRQEVLVLPFSGPDARQHADTLWRLHLLNGEPLRHQGHYAFHLAFEHMAPETTDLHLPPATRIPLSWSTRSIRSVETYSLCLQCLSRFRFFASLLCIICHSFVTTSCGRHISLSQASVHSRVVGPTSVLLRNFCSGLRRDCRAFIYPRETHSATKYNTFFHLRLEYRALTITGLHHHLASRIFSS